MIRRRLVLRRTRRTDRRRARFAGFGPGPGLGPGPLFGPGPGLGPGLGPGPLRGMIHLHL